MVFVVVIVAVVATSHCGMHLPSSGWKLTQPHRPEVEGVDLKVNN